MNCLFVNSKEGVDKRVAHLHDCTIRSHIKKFWDILSKDGESKVSKEDYMLLNVLISKFLLPDFEEQQARNSAEIEWKKDARGGAGITYEEFYHFIFEVVDAWAKGLLASQYLEVAKGIFHGITKSTQNLPAVSPLASSDSSRSAGNTIDTGRSGRSQVAEGEESSLDLAATFALVSLQELQMHEYPFFERTQDMMAIRGGTRPTTIERKNLSYLVPWWPIPLVIPIRSFPDHDAYDSDEEMDEIYKSSCPAILVLGKPHSGKTSLAAKLAATLGLVHLEIDAILTSDAHKNSEIGKEVEAFLKGGGVLRERQKMQIYEAIAHTSNTQLRGYVLDGDPQSVHELWNLHTWQCRPQYTLILDPPDSEILHRLAGARADPDTGSVHHVVTKNRNLKNLTKKKEAKEDATEEDQEEDGDEEEDEEEDEVGEDSSRSEPEKREERFVLLPEFSEGSLLQQLQDYASSFRLLEKKLSLLLEEKNIFRINSTQPLSELLKQSLELMRNFDPAPLPMSLPVPTQNSLEQQKKYLQIAELPEGLPPRTFSKWGTFCPVSLSIQHQLITGSFEHAVAFMGRVYLLANERFRQLFEENPKKFISATPPLPRHKTVMMWGPPLSGKTFYAKKLAERLGVLYLDVQKLLTEHMLHNTGIGITAKQKLQEGLEVPPQVYAQLIAFESGKESKGMPNWYGMPSGWVLDGFPNTPEQANALVSADLVPSTIIVLTEDDGQADRIRNSDAERSNSVVKDGANMPVVPSYEAWADNLDGIKSIFRRRKRSSDPIPDVVEISCGGPVPSIFGRIYSSIDPCNTNPIEADGDEGEEEIERMYGDTKFYCPVTLATKHQLIPGDPKHTVRWKNYLYNFVGKEEMYSFITAPNAYLPKCTPHAPAARLAIVGSKSSGKTSIAKSNGDSLALAIPTYVRSVKPEYRKERLAIKLAPEAPLPDAVVVENLMKLLDVEVFIGDFLETERGEWRDENGRDGNTVQWEDGLPQNADQLRLLLQHRYFLDSLVVLDVSESTSLKRNTLSPTAAQVDEVLERLKNKLEEAGEELPPDNILRHQATEEARNELDEALFESYDSEQKLQKELEDLANGSGIPIIHVSANSKHSSVVERAVSSLQLYLDQRLDIFSHAVAIKQDDATDLVETGTKSLSKFRYICPVNYFEKNDQVFPQEKVTLFPVVYRHHVFYCLDDQNRQKFLTTPNRYISKIAPSPYDPNVHVQVVVIGPPRSGKSSIVKRLAQKLGIARLSLGKVLKMVASNNSAMGSKIGDLLREGELLWDEMYVDAIQQVLTSQPCYPRGWILDGFPQNVVQAKLMIRKGIIPTNVIHLNIDADTCMERWNADLESTKCDKLLYNCKELLRDRINSYKQHENAINEYFSDNYGNVLHLDARKSKWALYEQAEKVVRSSLFAQVMHLHTKREAKPAVLRHNKYSTAEVYKKLSPLSTFCPVSLYNGELISVMHSKVSKPNSRPVLTHAVEYQGKIYITKGETEQQEFIRSPRLYSEIALPPSLPNKLAPESASSLKKDKLQLLGYCPVTLLLGSGYERFAKGREDLVLEYKSKFYTFVDEAKLEAFIRTPDRYAELVLPNKLPPPLLSITLSSLPVMGYLEQTISSAIVQSLLSLTRSRPLLPRTSTRDSALLFLALHLKANNPSSSKYLLSHANNQLQQFNHFASLIPSISKQINAITSLSSSLSHPSSSHSLPLSSSSSSPHPIPLHASTSLSARARRVDKILAAEDTISAEVKSLDAFLKFDLSHLIQIPNSLKNV